MTIVGHTCRRLDCGLNRCTGHPPGAPKCPTSMSPNESFAACAVSPMLIRAGRTASPPCRPGESPETAAASISRVPAKSRTRPLDDTPAVGLLAPRPGYPTAHGLGLDFAHPAEFWRSHLLAKARWGPQRRGGGGAGPPFARRAPGNRRTNGKSPRGPADEGRRLRAWPTRKAGPPRSGRRGAPGFDHPPRSADRFGAGRGAAFFGTGVVRRRDGR